MANIPSILSRKSDESLLETYASSKDLTFLGELYQRHAEMVYYVCLRYFKSKEQSEDAVVHIFEELIYKIDRQDIKNFSRWLYVVAKNHCLMALRAQKSKIPQISLDSFVEFSISTHQDESYTDREERLNTLEDCIEKLPLKQKQSVDLFFLQEKCYKEVVELTGFSMNEVKSYIQNGKRNLKNCMEKSDV